MPCWAGWSGASPPDWLRPAVGRCALGDRRMRRSLPADRPPLTQRQPAANDAIRHPDAQDDDQHPCQRDANQGEDQQIVDQQPPQGKPEGPDLPTEMAVQPGAAHNVALDVIEDDGEQRGNAEDESAGDRRGASNADDHGQRVQPVDHVAPGARTVHVGGRN